MSTKSIGFAILLAWAPGCIPWSVDDDPHGPIDCDRFDNAALRYPGVCGADGGSDGATAPGDQGGGDAAVDQGASDGGAPAVDEGADAT